MYSKNYSKNDIIIGRSIMDINDSFKINDFHKILNFMKMTNPNSNKKNFRRHSI